MRGQDINGLVRIRRMQDQVTTFLKGLETGGLGTHVFDGPRHVHCVSDDQAFIPHFVSEKVANDPTRAAGRSVRVEARDEQVSKHDHSASCTGRGTEGQEIESGQDVQRLMNPGEVEMRIHLGPAMAGKMLGTGQHGPFDRIFLKAPDLGLGKPGHLFRIRAVGPGADDGIPVIDVEVRDGCEDDVDSGHAGFACEETEQMSEKVVICGAPPVDGMGQGHGRRNEGPSLHLLPHPLFEVRENQEWSPCLPLEFPYAFTEGLQAGPEDDEGPKPVPDHPAKLTQVGLKLFALHARHYKARHPPKPVTGSAHAKPLRRSTKSRPLAIYYTAMAGRFAHLINDEIRYILLDMDGTLLDRYFDDYFWEHLLPERYAEKNHLTPEEARRDLLERYRKTEGTLQWTDLDYWSSQLKIDIPALKKQTEHLIDVHPHVIPFLTEMRRKQKSVVLVTNAHFKALDIKMRKTRLGPFLDRVVTSGDLGYPKERLEFWGRLAGILGEGYEVYAVLVDDTQAVLRTARTFGIRHLLHKAGASSALPVTRSDEFTSIHLFTELMD